MEKKKVFDIFNIKKSSHTHFDNQTKHDNIILSSINHGHSPPVNTQVTVHRNQQVLGQLISSPDNTANSKFFTVTSVILDLGNWDTGPVRPILKVRI